MSRIRTKKLGVEQSLVFTNSDRTEGSLMFNGSTFTFDKPLVFEDTITNSGITFLPNGTAANPSLSFTDSTGVGLFRSASNVLGIATAGQSIATFDASGNLNFSVGGIMGDRKLVTEATGATVALTAAMSGRVFFINSDSGTTTYTLPAPSAGLHYKWIVTANNNDPTVITTLDKTDTTGDMLRGALFLHSTDNDTTVLEAAGDVNTLTIDDNAANGSFGIGSWVEIICTEDPTWFVTGMVNGNTTTTSTGAGLFSDSDA